MIVWTLSVLCRALGADNVLFDINSTQIHSLDFSSALYTTNVSTDLKRHAIFA